MMVETGTVIAGRYQVQEIIGTGGMSDVYKALDTSLGRDVALKILKDEYVTDMSFVSKFKAEAMAAAGLEHPNIVNVYDVGNEDGHYYIVMEYVEGITLKTYITKKGHLSYNELLSIAIQAGRGIEAAHNKNIIHRDIKPQNIIISKEGKVKVTDFGIARAVTSNTINADRMGSVHYSSPEQARNGFVTYQSDIYSLGIVMYEMCTGRVPYDGDTTVAIAIQHLQSEMTPPSMLVSDVPKSVEKIILRATMKNPERRYTNITEMLTDLKKALVNPEEDFVFIPPAPHQGGETTAIPKITEETTEDSFREEENKEEAYSKIRDRRERLESDSRPGPIEDEEEDEDIDEPEAKGGRMDKLIMILGIAAAVVIVIIVIYLLGSFFGIFKIGGQGNKEPDTVITSSELVEGIKVPRVLGMDEREARKEIEDAGFEYRKLGESSSDEYEEGQVMEQDPAYGETAEPGDTIMVLISSGKGDIPVPTVTGYERDQAVKNIEDMGFVASVQTSYSEDVEEGKVVRQSPDGSGKAKEGDTITLWISQGPEPIAVPSVTGKSEEEAKQSLTTAGFKVNTLTEESNSVAKGYVIRQNPAGTAAKGAEITLYVSSGTADLYRFSTTVSPVDGNPTYVVLKGPSDEELAHVMVTSYNTTLNVSNMPVSSGTLYFYSEDRSFEVADRRPVSFILQ